MREGSGVRPVHTRRAAPALSLETGVQSSLCVTRDL